MDIEQVLNSELILRKTAKAFEDFRRQTGQTRGYPKTLQSQALGQLDAGVSKVFLAKTLKLTPKTISDWVSAREKISPKPPQARCLVVVNDKQKDSLFEMPEEKSKLRFVFSEKCTLEIMRDDLNLKTLRLLQEVGLC